MGEGVTAFSTTRKGGYSTGNYASFNINRYCGDSEEHIVKNRATLCQLLGITDDHLIMPHQTHETRVRVIDEAFWEKTADGRKVLLEGVDAVMTNFYNVCIGVSTADCVPILLYDSDNHAICAVHAGWRGTVRRIVEKAICAMTEYYGTHPEHVVAQIGPGIRMENYEVGNEVYETFHNEGFDMTTIAKRYPTRDNGSTLNTTKWHIDLPKCNHLQLMAVGVPEQNILCSEICTFQHHDMFFSARRLGISSGRIFTGIMIDRQSHTTEIHKHRNNQFFYNER